MNLMRSGSGRGRAASESLAICAALLLQALLAGCGSGSKPLPPPQKAVQPPAPSDEGASEIAASEPGHAAPQSSEFAAKPNLPKSISSGDSEPFGREEAFALLADPGQGGSQWSLDLPDAENNVDRFAYVPVPRGIDSRRFVVEAGEGGIIPTGDENEIPVPERAGSMEGTARLPKGFVAVPGVAVSSDGLPFLIQCQLDGAVMGLVTEGAFIQGKDGAEANASPAHATVLDTYYIDLREVTFDRYEKYRAAAKEQDSKKRIAEPSRTPRDRHEPVTGITWAEARAYALWSSRELPTEAQWEKAARGIEGFEFPWGNGPALFHRSRTPDQLDRVGIFPGDKSPFGIYDMAGNAREWCSDWYHEKYYQQLKAESGATAHNPTGPRGSTGGSQRVVKGGDSHWRVWARAGMGMADRAADVGFRCVLKLRGKAEGGKRKSE